MKKKKFLIILLTITITILIITFNFLKTERFINIDKSVTRINLKTSEEKIKEKVLRITPIDTSMEDVYKVIEINKWEIVWIREKASWDYTDISMDFIKGAKSIRADIGGYRIVFRTDVQVYWGFDEDDKLIEIGVRKDIDSL